MKRLMIALATGIVFTILTGVLAVCLSRLSGDFSLAQFCKDTDSVILTGKLLACIGIGVSAVTLMGLLGYEKWNEDPYDDGYYDER
jgi:hypothetical protein